MPKIAYHTCDLCGLSAAWTNHDQDSDDEQTGLPLGWLRIVADGPAENPEYQAAMTRRMANLAGEENKIQLLVQANGQAHVDQRLPPAALAQTIEDMRRQADENNPVNEYPVAVIQQAPGEGCDDAFYLCPDCAQKLAALGGGFAALAATPAGGSGAAS